MGESRFAARDGRDNGEAGAARATGAAGLFPRLLQAAYGRSLQDLRILARQAPDQLFSSDLIFLSNSSNEVRP